MGGTKLTVTTDAVWRSGNTGVLTVTAGVAHGVKAGSANVTASVNGVDSAPLKITVTNPPTLGSLTVTATARDGGQTLAVKETLGNGNMRRYKITNADAKPTVAYDTACVSADGWVDYPANGQVSGTAGQVATVVELTTQGAKARMKGEATLPAPTTP